MPSDAGSSDLSSLSSLSPAPSDNELNDLSDADAPPAKSGILKFFSKVSDQEPREASPPPRKRSPSPPHEYVLADNPDIAFVVMFRSRFSDAFPKSLAHFGPQELERDVVGSIPGDRVENFLCALLGLLLNRKQDVKPGHYGRALEDAITSHKAQWPKLWQGRNPLSGGNTFNAMTPTDRLLLLRTLVLWTMASSDTVKSLINASYKQNRHEDDLNQPRSVQPWGSDADKRRYFLIEGQDDTHFRVYRESNPAATARTWWSVAGSIDELKDLVDRLQEKDGRPKSKALGFKMLQAIPRFEAGDEKRKRREYRQMQKERFKRPEPGFSMYEGRTRGKRMKYTYSDDEELYSDSNTRRFTRNTGTHTPVETGPVTTSSGRQIRAPTRLNVDESASASAHGELSEPDHEAPIGPTGRPRRAAAPIQGTTGREDARRASRRSASAESDDEDSEEVDYGDDEQDDEAHVPGDDEDEEDEEDDYDVNEAMVDDDLGGEPQSRIVNMNVGPPKLKGVLTNEERQNGAAEGLSGAKEPGAPPAVPALGDVTDTPAGNKMEVDAAPQNPLKSGESVDKNGRPATSDSAAHDAHKGANGTTASTLLAFRGSPEKRPAQLPSAHVVE